MAKNELQKLSKDQAIDLATRMKGRAMKVRQNADRITERAISGVVTAVAGFGVGWWMGSAEVEYQENVSALLKSGKTQEDAEKEAEDPRKWMGIDKDLLVALGLTGAAMMNVGGRKVAPVIEASGFGALAGWAYAKGMDLAITGADDDVEEEAAV